MSKNSAGKQAATPNPATPGGETVPPGATPVPALKEERLAYRDADINQVLAYLAQRPYVEVAGLILKLQTGWVKTETPLRVQP